MPRTAPATEAEGRAHHYLFLFFALTFGWSWGCWLLSGQWVPQSTPLGTAIFYAANFGPTLAAIAVVIRSEGRDGLRRWLAQCVGRNFAWGLIILALLLPLITVALAALIQFWLDGTVTSSPGKGHLLMVGVNVVLIFLIGGPLGEEFGWRGYAQNTLQRKYDWRIVSLGLGIIWGIWHAPLFLMPQTPQSALPFSLFFASALGLSVISGWLYERSKESLIPVMIFHTVINASPMFVATTKDLRIYGISVALMSVVAVGLLFAKSAVHRSDSETLTEPSSFLNT